MKWRLVTLMLAVAAGMPGCTLLGCNFPRCHSESRASSSLVEFLYPRGAPPAHNTIPELHLPLRVGLAFLPSQNGPAEGLEAARREELLERIREHFADRKFVREIVIVPDYYLRTSGGFGSPAGVQRLNGFGSPAGLQPLNGFDSLAGVQRLYALDIMALVSYDQVMYRDQNSWSLGYLTIVGAYVLKGNRHDVTTLMDLAVVDPESGSIVLRAGGTDTRHGNTTLIKDSRESRESRMDGFSAATDQLVGNFDTALTRFESDVRAGKAKVRVVSNGKPVSGGGGALSLVWVALLLLAVASRPLVGARRMAQSQTASKS